MLKSEEIKTFLFLYFIFIFFQVNAQEREKKMYFQGYSGGMMIHAGYLWAKGISVPNAHEQIKMDGMTWGIGGLMRLHFGKHFRVGGEGYNSSLHYGKNKSYATLSWGGLLLDCKWKINKFTLFLGGTVGGGSVKNIRILDAVSPNSTEKNAIYRKYTVMIADPFLGMEYAISQRLYFITKADYIFNITEKQPDFAKGIRIYAGFVFFHTRKSKQ